MTCWAGVNPVHFNFQLTLGAAPFFANVDDRNLMSLGVFEDSISLDRCVSSEADLDTVQIKLPVEAYEGLFLVAAGDTVSAVLSARETLVDQLALCCADSG